jgi:hypothetical protein
MQNIILMLLLSLGYLQADRVGVDEKRWVDAPKVSDDVYQVSEAGIGEEIVIPADSAAINKNIQRGQMQTLSPKSDEKKFDFDKYQKLLVDFVAPLGTFIKEYTLLFASFLTLLTSLFYLMFYRPLARKIANHYDEEIEIAQVRTPSQKMQAPLTQESAILSSHQYSTLSGLISESFLYEKERVLLDKSLSQESQNREVISLEWKFNQILHFSLPKLSTRNIERFKEGIKELLDEEITRDIMIIALEDIMIEEVLTAEEKREIKKIMNPYLKKDEPLYQAANTNTPKAINYTNYMVQ